VTDLELAYRMVLSLLFGTLVGLERQWHHKTAGLKTNTLVAIGATAITLVAERGFGPDAHLPQVAAGVVTGIGFIGGGVIMRRGGNVQGINSAATLWATASLGLAIGAGFYHLAWLVLAIVLAVQFLERGLANWIDRRSHFISALSVYTLQVEFSTAAETAVRSVWSDFAGKPGVALLHFSQSRTGETESALEWRMGLSETRIRELAYLAQALAALRDVRRATWSRVPVDDDDRS